MTGQKDILSQLPSILEVKMISQAIALLDAIISPEWESRYYSFDSRWDYETQLASMRNGSGDNYYILFTPVGAAVKVFLHEFRQNPDLIPAELSKDFSAIVLEPAFEPNDTTYFVWRNTQDKVWSSTLNEPSLHQTKDPLHIFINNPETYFTWATRYYEKDIPLVLVEKIFKSQPIELDTIMKFNPNISVEMLNKDMEEIGYNSSLMIK